MSNCGLKFGSVPISPETKPSTGPTAKFPAPVIVYPSPLSTTETDNIYNPLGPSIVPTKLWREPFSIVPAIFIWLPAKSVSTVASPPIWREFKSGLKFLSVCICPSTFPSTGPAVNAPPPSIVYESPLSVTAAVKRYIPFGPVMVPSKLCNDPASMVPAMFIWFPASSVSTVASPESTALDISGVKLWSVKISP